METQNDPGKTVAILSYITIIGFIVALVLNSDERNKSELGVFHLRQALGIFLTGIILAISNGIFVFIPFLGWLMNLAIIACMLALFVFWILALVSAINGEKKAIPVLGDFYQNTFSGIK